MDLSDSWLKANNGKKITHRMERTDRDGLSVRVTSQGKIIFQIRYRYNGKLARLDIGTYPRMALKDVRAQSQRFKAKLEKGHDPRVVKQLEKEVIVSSNSLQDLFHQWYESYCKQNKKGHHEILRSFELYVFPKLGKLPAEQLTVHEWLSLLEPRAKETPSIAQRILTNAKQMLKWAVRRRLVSVNPITDINAVEDLNFKQRG